MLSVITTNIFPITPEDLKFTINNLKNQTFKDIEWVFCDHYYEENKNLVKELCNFPVIHFSLCEIKHVGASWHWELYNNALLLTTRKHFIRFGMYRYMHRRTLEFTVESITKDGIYTDQTQQKAHNNVLSMDNVERGHGLSIASDQISNYPITHCGMFSMSRQEMVDIGGNNETLVRHHFEDCDLNARFRSRNFPVNKFKMRNLKNSFLRLDHKKDECNKPYGMKTCNQEACINNFHGFYDQTIKPHPKTLIFDYRDFKWYSCPNCYCMAPYNVDEYYKYQENYKSPLAPIGVLGKLGRNLQVLNEDIQKLTSLDNKVDLLKSSHTDQRYLQDRL